MNRISIFSPRNLSICVFMIILSGSSCSKLNDIQNSVNELKLQNDSLQAQLTSMKNTLELIETLSQQNADSLNDIHVKIDSLLSMIALINQQLESNTTDISQIEQELLLLTQDYQSLLALINQMMACCPQCNMNLNNGLVAYYPFTGNAGDSSGYGNDAFVHGATLTTDRFGKANSAYNFSGTSVIEAVNRNWINFDTSSFSISAWVNMTVPQPSSFNGILTKGNANAFIYQLGIDSTNAAGEFGNPFLMDFTHLKSSQYMTAGNWYSLSMIIKRDSNMVQLYVNGTLSASFSSAAISTQNITSTDSLRIGVERDGLFHFNGKIDDIRIYNRALNNAEITWLASH